MLNRPSKAAIVPVGLITALLAAIAVSLWLLLGGLVQAQETTISVNYYENDTAPVITLSAMDPEGVTPTDWDILDSIEDPATSTTIQVGGAELLTADIEDRLLFSVNTDGELSFENSPNYEVAGDVGAGNEYNVVVEGTDRGNLQHRNWFKVTVRVMDVEEEGVISWTVDPDGDADAQSLSQFQAGAALAASLTDPDGPEGATLPLVAEGAFGIEAANVTWKWYRSESKSGPWTLIPRTDADGTYSPTDAPADNNDVDKHVRVMATYTDRKGDRKTAEFVSSYPVQAARTNNTVPTFGASDATRRMSENTLPGVPIGTPVAATDDDDDVLNYRLTDGGDNGFFDIDSATGQIMSGEVGLNFEDAADEGTNNEYEVTVTAFDSSGAPSAPIVVAITVIDVNEAPTFSTPAVAVTKYDHMEGVTAIDSDPAPANDEATIYTASNPEGGAVTLTLSGVDSDKFELLEPAADSPTGTRMLAFKAAPDFENPSDQGRDNIYELTIVASDGTVTSMRSAIVKVIDVSEPGKVALSTQDAVIGVPLTATLTDSDGGVNRVTWAWYGLVMADDDLSDNEETGNRIADAESATYTPVGDDENMFLRAKATYFDRIYDPDPDDIDTTEDGTFRETAVSSATTVVHDAPANTAPRFKEGSATERYVEENAPNERAIGGPVEATDSDGDTPTYSLGSDQDPFDINASTGQISVKDGTKLDYEQKKTYTVRVTATDSSGESNDRATISVSIKVTDLDEQPTVDDKANRGGPRRHILEYEENETDTVLALVASDPERVSPANWDILESFTDPVTGDAIPLDGENLTLEDIADRALFKINADGQLNFKEPPDYEEAADAGEDNEYHVVVEATDRGDLRQRNWFKVTVTVTNMEEKGEVVWTVDPGTGTPGTGTRQTLLQFQSGALLTAELSDPDGETSEVTWRWERSSRPTGSWTAIADANAITYSPKDSPPNASDVNKYLRVVASYTVGTDTGLTAEFVSPNPVQALKINMNTVPEFASITAMRRVTEDASVGSTIGAPVTAVDEAGDILTYSVAVDPDEPFSINRATGQLMTTAKLNFEMTAEYTVMVTATDSVGATTAAPATVTIAVTGVNEAPTFSPDPATIIDHMEGGTVIDTNLITDGEVEPASYTASDPEGGAVALTLAGVDSDKFELLAPAVVPDVGISRVLAFKAAPDFETPGDRNKDNIYEVTVVASDGNRTSMQSVSVKVIDVSEDGTVTLSPQDARIGVPITATLTDSDGWVSRVTWAWYRLAGADEPLNDDEEDSNRIADAESATYTPVVVDNTMVLKARATYFDRTYDDETFQNMAASNATTAVRDDPSNSPPSFGGRSATERYVEENAADDRHIGDPVAATDPYTGNTITYSLSGADADSFTIEVQNTGDPDPMVGGQIRVKAGAKLDYEKKNSYTVVVTATDSSGEANNSAAITVTIKVTDLDEMPTITAIGASTLRISGSSSVTYAENDTGDVEDYSVSGTNGATATWSLTGTDRGDFDISEGGVVTFKSPPDYESQSSYTFTVNAAVNGANAERDVTVSVTNVEEPGVATVPPDPVVGFGITATLADDDGVTGTVNWQWSRETTAGVYEDISGANAPSYTPVAADDGKHLRVTASYSDGRGSGKSAVATTTNLVVMRAAGPGDANNDGMVDKGEMIEAFRAYVADPVSKTQIIAIFRQYVADSAGKLGK